MTQRNDPCPCGSGKKFKKCCDKPVPLSPTALLGKQILNARETVVDALFKFTEKQYGDEGLFDAWNEFFLQEPLEYDLASPEAGLFLPYFLFHWTPEFLELESTESEPEELSLIPPAVRFLNERANKLAPLEELYLKEAIAEPLTFWEVVGSMKEGSFVLRDILTERKITVDDEMGSDPMLHGNFIFGKVVTVQNYSFLDAAGPHVFAPSSKGPILNLRKFISQSFSPVRPKDLHMYQMELLEIYDQFRDSILNPTAPILTNTDGDPLENHTLFYTIDSADDAFEKLYSLNTVDSKTEQLEMASYTKEGRISSIEIPWLKSKNNTVLGRLQITDRALKISVNSAKRARKIQSIIDKKLGNSATYLRTVIEPMENYLAQLQANGKISNSKTPSQPNENSPEIQAHIEKLIQLHWKNWVHDKLPALGGKTPLQAVKDKEGREMVEALLLDFERREGQRPELPSVPIQKLRERLGLL